MEHSTRASRTPRTTRTTLINRKLPNYTKGEELFNTVSHIVGGGLSLAALALCLAAAILYGSVWSIVAGAIYAGSLILLYTMSSLYHGLKPVTAKKVFQVIDHCSIFLLIAGTYTPLLLCNLRPSYPALAWGLMALVWGCAVLGITLNSIDIKKYAKFSMIAYLGMGWSAVLALKQFASILPLPAIILIFLGGIFYTSGAIIYGLGKKHKYMHGIFHVFVVIGSVTHFFAIVLYSLPK
ncbi:MAG: hemolysin III family protein [Peptococcaceae bacterium]|nr:hemolysin III family protein [Peptococcaceae bacterium]